MVLSVIMPVLNEADVLPEQLAHLLVVLAPCTAFEVIVVDGGSTDNSVDIARGHGCQVVASAPGRGTQMNAGVAASRGEILLFLHADTQLPEPAVGLIEAALTAPQVVGGGFGLCIDSRDGFLRMVAATATWRSRRFNMFYGDQAMFVRRMAFAAVGGYPDQPLMEDIALVHRLRRRGKLVLLAASVVTSARRWERENPLYTTLRNWLLVILYSWGVAPETLVRWYRPK